MRSDFDDGVPLLSRLLHRHLLPHNIGNSSTALFFFDTGGGTLDEAVDSSQVAWYRNTSAALADNGTTTGLAFLHIPLPEYAFAAPRSADELRRRAQGPSVSLEVAKKWKKKRKLKCVNER